MASLVYIMQRMESLIQFYFPCEGDKLSNLIDYKGNFPLYLLVGKIIEHLPGQSGRVSRLYRSQPCHTHLTDGIILQQGLTELMWRCLELSYTFLSWGEGNAKL